MRTLLGGIFVVALAGLAGNRAQPAQDKEKNADLKGIWKLVRTERNGEEVNLEKNLPRWVIDGKTVRYGGEMVAKLSVVPNSKPRGLDLAWTSPKREFEAIYEVEGDTHKI